MSIENKDELWPFGIVFSAGEYALFCLQVKQYHELSTLCLRNSEILEDFDEFDCFIDTSLQRTLKWFVKCKIGVVNNLINTCVQISSAHIRSKSPPKTRTALINNKQVVIDGKTINEPKELPRNRVVTAKYTIYNFVPKNLFEQFRRIANFYFLCIAIIQCTTKTPVSPVTSLVPLIFVVTTTAVKQAYEDWLRHKSDNVVNKRLVPILVDYKLVDVKSEDIKVGNIVLVKDNEEIPCDLVILSSTLAEGKCSVTTANLDGETNLKVRESLPCTVDYQKPEDFQKLSGVVECEQPNTDLYEFVGVLKLCVGKQVVPYPLSANNLLLRGSRLKNTGHVYGVAVYTGCETKMALNSRLTSNKFSSIERTVNKSLIAYFVLLLFMSCICTVLRFVTSRSQDVAKPWYLLSLHNVEFNVKDLFNEFLSFFVLYNYIIPISLYVSLEMVKFFGSKTLVSDAELFDVENQQRPTCNSSDLNEELGQVEYLFSDKTGTLTENMMRFTACTINGVHYVEKDKKLWLSNSELEPVETTEITSDVEEFLVALNICNTCHVVSDGVNYKYHGDSPDEKAFVEASHELGVTLSMSSDKECDIIFRQEKRNFKKLYIFEFDSTRKRMSVIAKDEKDQVFLICKGAETVLCELITEGKIQETMDAIDKYAHHGLRTLVIAIKKFTPEQYAEVEKEILDAATILDNRKTRLAAIYTKIESKLTLLGATAVEDSLQEGVPEAISDLKLAGIKVWVLTGDKLETAVSVAYSCHLLDEKMQQFLLSRQQNSDSCGDLLKQFHSKIVTASKTKKDKSLQHALIADGRSLYMAMKFHKELFQALCEECDVVLCCRMSPIQKAEVVHMMKTSRKRPVTAAIGDGANDVSMIQEAHVGFGLMGKEGRQAVNSSDFAFSKFRFIRRALLVHGHLFYSRVSTMIHYFFYKNVVFVAPQFVFSFYNTFSAQTLYHGMLLMAYNVLFTAAPVVVYGITEKYIPSEILDKFPELYKLIRHNRQMTFWQFFKWFLVGAFHGLIIFYCFKDIWGTGTTLYSSGHFGSLYAFGTMIYHGIVLVVNMELIVMTRHWNIYFTSSVAISMLCVPAFLIIYTNFKWGFINDDLFGVYTPLFSSISFWCSLFIVSIIALIPDVLYLVMNNSLNFNEFPHLIDRQRVQTGPQAVTEANVHQNARPVAIGVQSTKTAQSGN